MEFAFKSNMEDLTGWFCVFHVFKFLSLQWDSFVSHIMLREISVNNEETQTVSLCHSHKTYVSALMNVDHQRKPSRQGKKTEMHIHTNAHS